MEDEIAGEAHYVLVLLFVKYVSDKYAGDPNGLIRVPAGGGFADMVVAKGEGGGNQECTYTYGMTALAHALISRFQFRGPA